MLIQFIHIEPLTPIGAGMIEVIVLSTITNTLLEAKVSSSGGPQINGP